MILIIAYLQYPKDPVALVKQFHRRSSYKFVRLYNFLTSLPNRYVGRFDDKKPERKQDRPTRVKTTQRRRVASRSRFHATYSIFSNNIENRSTARQSAVLCVHIMRLKRGVTELNSPWNRIASHRSAAQRIGQKKASVIKTSELLQQTMNSPNQHRSIACTVYEQFSVHASAWFSIV